MTETDNGRDGGGAAAAGSARHRDRGRGPRTERDLRRRTLSQNFLRDRQAVERFLATVDLDPAGLVVEVGAGEGALTAELARRSGRVIAYEVDPRLAARLAATLRDQANVCVAAEDFLAATPPSERFHLVGNVPFSVTSRIVDWCLTARKLTAATMITQLEYARKRTGWYGRWSLLTIQSWPRYQWELRTRIPRAEFRPVPRVDAGVLHIARRADPLIPRDAMAAYRRMVDLGFSGLGGSLHASLTRRYPAKQVTSAFRAAGVDRDIVVGFAAPEDWLRLFAALEGPPARRSASRNPGPLRPR